MNLRNTLGAALFAATTAAGGPGCTGLEKTTETYVDDSGNLEYTEICPDLATDNDGDGSGGELSQEIAEDIASDLNKYVEGVSTTAEEILAICEGYVQTEDCDDTDASVNPDAQEIPYDGIDNNCDGADLIDVDQDGFTSTEVGGTDCKDSDSTINPSATEVWYDGTDQDCNGKSDFDADEDGFASDSHVEEGEKRGGTDCDDTDSITYPGAIEIEDGKDNDCDNCFDEEEEACDEDIPESNDNDPVNQEAKEKKDTKKKEDTKKENNKNEDTGSFDTGEDTGSYDTGEMEDTGSYDTGDTGEEEVDPSEDCTAANGDTDEDCFTDVYEKKNGTDSDDALDFPSSIPVDFYSYRKIVADSEGNSDEDFDDGPVSSSIPTDSNTIIQVYSDSPDQLFGFSVNEAYLGTVNFYECDGTISNSTFPSEANCDLEPTVLNSFADLDSETSDALSGVLTIKDATTWLVDNNSNGHAGFMLEAVR
jgi:hypothetical protein